MMQSFEYKIQTECYNDIQLTTITICNKDVEKCYWVNGNIWWFRNYKDNNLHGLYKEYYTNGFVKWECYYKNDKIHGLYKRYRINGDIRNEYNYVNGNKVF